MTRSDYDAHGRVLVGRVRGYHRDGDNYVKAPHMSMSHPYAAGSLLSAVDDLARWDAALDCDRIVAETTHTVPVEDGQLVTQRSGGGKSTAVALSDDRFYYPDP